MEQTMDELNQKCMECIANAEKRFRPIDRTKCQYCPTGIDIHRLEVKSQSKWNKVDWNDSRFKEFYHG